jgi:hypothetical protein
MEPSTPHEYFIPISFLFIILAPAGIFLWVLRRVRIGLLTPIKGARSFLAYSLVPVTLYAAVSPLSMAAEWLLDLPLVGEAYRRSFFAVLVIGGANAVVLCSIFYMVAKWYSSQR